MPGRLSNVDRLGKRRSADAGQIVRGHLLEDGEFWPERGDEPVNDRVNALAVRLHGDDLANNFRKRNEIIEVRVTLGAEAIRAVCEFSDPAQDPDGDWFMTLRACSVTRAFARART